MKPIFGTTLVLLFFVSNSFILNAGWLDDASDAVNSASSLVSSKSQSKGKNSMVK